MDYKQKYEDALERARNIRFGNPQSVTANVVCEEIFPELKESEDAKIRKRLIEGMRHLSEENLFFDDVPKDKVIAWLKKQSESIDKEKVLIGARKGVALSIMNFLDRNTLGMCLSNMECKDLEDAVVDSDWSKVYNYMKKKLEKQSEQKPTDKVEPKFKIGDIIINEYGFIMQIDGIDGNMYVYHVLDGNILLKHNTTKTDESCHLWTIKDAKDGDILTTDNDSICIFDGMVEDGKYPFAYCGLTRLYGFEVYNGKLPFTHDNNVHPATKEQRDLLFQKMKESGYEWDAEKKELKKIEQKPNFCHHEVDLSGCSEEYHKAYYDGWNNCNQQHAQLEAEQNPAWSEEDEKILSTVIEKGDLKPSEIGWLKSLKERMKRE